MADNELYHYGVLGMKWGVRRARKNAEKAAAARRSAKQWDSLKGFSKGSDRLSTAARNSATKRAAKDRARAAKYEAKSKAIENKHRKRAGSKTYDRVKNTSTGKLFVESMMMTTYGAMKYNQAKAERNVSTGKAFLESQLYGTGQNLTGGLLGFIEPRMR